MKRYLLIILFLLPANIVLAQEKNEDREAQHKRIKALKVAFITQELELTDKLAQQFWPIYNEYEIKKRKLHEREHIELEDVSCYNEEQADELLNEFLAVENEEYKIKKQLFRDLKQIITAKDIIKLHKLEDEFHKKLIREYRAKKGNNNSSDD
ncbi:hypothetical protein [Christiangramia portivictoriae]|uniref:hypothetical protein n=1 Tax=Christiangramia portivictoriae TaxID=326069 RepID=UPI0004112E03|nr:hypothetical protein [Christiangramia portivictoriae]